MKIIVKNVKEEIHEVQVEPSDTVLYNESIK